eukprot:g5294.t1
MHQQRFCFLRRPWTNWSRIAVCLPFVFPAALDAGEPAQPAAFKHAGVIEAWKTYRHKLTFGKGQTLALLDDGCTLSKPEWSKSDGDQPKVLVTYDSVDGDSDPSHEGRGYHGSTIGIPSSLNYKGKWGVAYNNQVAVIRGLECCHCNVKDGKTLAAGLQWVIDNHKRYRITTVNLAPVDDKAHDKPVATAIDAKLTALRRLGIWVSAPTGNHNFTTGISWPACQPDCFAIGAVRPGKDIVYLDRHAKVDLVVPAAATSSSNAIACGAAMVLREAIQETHYDWKKDGPTIADAMLAIMQKTGVNVNDPATKRSYRRLDLSAALRHVFAGAKPTNAIRFSEHLIADKYAYAYGIAAADFDRDGDLDLTSADYTPNNMLYLFENNSRGKFKKHIIQKDDPKRLERHMVGDVDGDGDLDVVIVKNLYGHLLWFENSGKPMNGKLWKRHVITTDLPGAYDVALADFDKDGDLDVAASSWKPGSQFAWFENDGTPANGLWKKHMIEDKVAETRTMRTADFDGDGDIDLLGTGRAANQVIWYENTRAGGKVVWKKHLIDAKSKCPAHGNPVDMDGDGDIDVVMALGFYYRPGSDDPTASVRREDNQVVWYENNGSPAKGNWKKHVIGPEFDDAFEAVAGDLDGDGDIDVAATSWRNPGRVVWYENHGDPKGKWTRHMLKNNWRSANQVIIADLNGDGRPDIAASQFRDASKALGFSGGGQVSFVDYNSDGWVDIHAGKLYRNEKGKRFVVVKNAPGGAGIWGDFDNDGHPDFFTYSGKGALFRNLGDETFERIPFPELPTVNSLGAVWVDINNDGLLDLYVGGYEIWTKRVHPDAIFLNHGKGVFKEHWRSPAGNNYSARGVTAADFDEDGAIDVYVSNYRLQPNFLWKNDGRGKFTEVGAKSKSAGNKGPVIGYTGGIRYGLHGHTIGSCFGDLDNDGHLDLFVGNFAHPRAHQDRPQFLRNRGPAGGFVFEDKSKDAGLAFQESFASPALGDYDNDGDLDLFFTTVYPVASGGIRNYPVLYRNEGNWKFRNVTAAEKIPNLPATYQAAWADIDNDGDLDLCTAGKLFLNENRKGNWIEITLVGDGKAVNRSAIGATVYGTRRALPWFSGVFSAMALMFSFAAGLPLLIAARLGMGASQSGIFPCAVNTIARWLPETRRSMASGLLASFMSVGGAFGAVLIGWMLPNVGWRIGFTLFALPGFVFAVWFYWWFRETPEEHSATNAAERDLIRGPAESRMELPDVSSTETTAEPTPWRVLFTNVPVMALCAQQVFRAVGYIFFASWFATYLRESRGVTQDLKAGFLSSLPLLAVVVGSPLGGWIADAVFARTGSRRLSRQGVASISMTICFVLILCSYPVADPWLAVSLITAGAFFAAMGGPSAYTAAIDLGGKHVTMVFSLMNMAGNIGAFVFPILVPYLLNEDPEHPGSGNWDVVLFSFAGSYLVAAVCWLFVNPDRGISPPPGSDNASAYDCRTTMRSHRRFRKLSMETLRAISVFVIGLACLAGPVAADDAASPGVSAKSPQPPAVAVKQLVAHPQLRVELVACEPQVVDPVAIAFDEDGRLWVVEMRDYPNGPKDLGSQPKEKGKRPRGLSRVRLLEDRDGDGFYETACTFADGLLFATGVQPWRGGVIVTLAGEVAYFKDTTGDGKADLRETWFTGFAEKNPQLRANHPTFALDNRIYVANGLRGGDVVARKPAWAKIAKPVSISGMDFRFDARTGAYEAVSGPGQFGLTFDDFGNRFVCSNRNPCRHVVLEDRYLKRNTFLAVGSVLHDVSPAGEQSRVYPISRTWTTSNLHAGQFTAACGVTIYRGDLLPVEFRGNSFTCEPTGNLVHRDVLKRHGVTFTSKPGREKVEFLTSKDEWFRPVNLANGPDGALYVVDMYRTVIEHPQWVPTELKHRPDERFGDDRGRIYRVVPANTMHKRRTPEKLSRARTADLVKLLEHSNAWQRMTAARLLCERQDTSAVAALARLAQDRTKSQRARVHALWSLNGLGRLDKSLVASILPAAARSGETQLLAHALRLAERHLSQLDATILTAIVSQSKSSQARFQGVLSLGALPDASQRISALAHAGLSAADDVWIRSAIVSSAAGIEVKLLEQLVDRLVAAPKVERRNSSGLRALFGEIARIAGLRGRESEVRATLNALSRLQSGQTNRVRQPAAVRLGIATLDGLAHGINRRGKRLETHIAALPAKKKKQIASLLNEVLRIAKSSNEPRARRLEAIPLLEHLGYSQAGAVLKHLATEEQDQSLRVAAIAAWAGYREPEIARVLLAGFKAQSPAIKRSILDALLADKTRTAALLDEITAKRISINELDPARVRRLTRYRDRAIRSRAARLLAAAIPADRKSVLAEYQRALALTGDATRGRQIFKKNCAACHRIAGIGVTVAPDISDSRTKTPAQLLVSILDPNRAIDNNYISYSAQTTDGKVHTGVIATETATSITLRQAENKTVSLLRRDIEELNSNGVSLMPAGLEKNINVQQMADLIAFIKNWRYLDGRLNMLINNGSKLMTLNILRSVLMGFVLVATASIGFAGEQPPAKKVFRAGAATSNITPPLGELIVGGWKPFPATHIHDELHARCLVLDDGSSRIAIVLCDNVGIPREVYDTAKSEIQKQTGIPASHVLCAATHTHSATTARGPNSMVYAKTLNAYQSFVALRIADGVRRAVNQLEPARIGWGRAKETSQVFNRRWHTTNPMLRRNPFGGVDQVRMNPPRGDKSLLRPAGPIDPEIAFISLQSRDGRPIALLANYSLHYVGGVPGGHVSADYFAVFANRIAELLDAEKTNPRFVGILSNGTSGDINNINFRARSPRRKPYEKMEEVGRLVAQRVYDASKSISYHDWVPLAAAKRDLKLKVRKPDSELLAYVRKIQQNKPDAKKYHSREQNYARRVLQLAESPDTVTVPLQAVRIGELAIAAIPFEVFVEIGLEIKDKTPFKQSFTIELANGSYGYLPTPEQHKLGGYETWMGTNRVEKPASDKIVKQILKMFNDLKR